jgi:hypothetical protein
MYGVRFCGLRRCHPASFNSLTRCWLCIIPAPCRLILIPIHLFIPALWSCVSPPFPCRIQYCTQEIVVFREDLLSKMQRHCVLPPNNSPTIDPHLHVCASAVHVRLRTQDACFAGRGSSVRRLESRHAMLPIRSRYAMLLIRASPEKKPNLRSSG